MKTDYYSGREHALVKHTLLKSYLEKLFMIIGLNQKVIWYVDCFSGPWAIEENDSELKATSIAISIEIMQKCKQVLKAVHNRDVIFKALYIEKSLNPYKRLESFLQTVPNSIVETHCIHGDFYNLRQELLNTVGSNDFVFFFIDPKGWKYCIELPTLTPLLKRANSEFLINFMFDFINRTHTQVSHQKDMVAIFGEEPDTKDCTPLDREKCLIDLYRENLKSVISLDKHCSRTAYVSILDPIKNRTKYHLVYLTRHPLGIIKFIETSQEIDIVQNVVRAMTRQEREEEKTGQPQLFNDYECVSEDTHLYSLLDIKQYFLDTLSIKPIQFGLEEMASLIEKKGWFLKDIQKAFKELQNDGKVINMSAKIRRPKHPIHFLKNENQGELLAKV